MEPRLTANLQLRLLPQPAKQLAWDEPRLATSFEHRAELVWNLDRRSLRAVLPDYGLVDRAPSMQLGL